MKIANPEIDILLDGETASSRGIYITKRPEIPTPERRYEEITVPGRNGSLLVEDEFDDITYSVEFNTVDPGGKSKLREVKGFLFGKKKLQFSDDMSAFYKIKAVTVEPIANPLSDVGIFTVNFRLDPFAYLEEISQLYQQRAYVFNHGTYWSEPIITVYGSGDGKLYIGSYVLEIRGLTNSITIDCELKHAYGTSITDNKNRNISGEYPRLMTGRSRLSWSGGITQVSINGRWRCI